MPRSTTCKSHALELIAILAALLVPGVSARAQAPAAPAASAAKASAPVMPKEIALTDKQIQGVLDSQKDFDALGESMPKTDAAQSDPKYTAQFETTAKKYGFASYADYNEAIATVSVVLAGFDPKTKTYVGPEAVLKQQIAAVQADKQMPAKDKQDALKEMNVMLKSPPPASQNKANIDLVAKYYDKLAAALQDE